MAFCTSTQIPIIVTKQHLHPSYLTNSLAVTMQFFLNSSRFADTFAAAAAPGGGGSSLPTAPTAPGAAALLPAGDGRAATTG